MDHSWRAPHLPPIPGSISNICPICSTSHFPFCPPPPFIENPRFHYSQSQNDYYHQRPRFDHPHPFPNHQSSSSYNYNHNYHPIDGHAGRRPTWYGSNPSLGMSQHNAISAPPMVNNYHSGGVATASYGHEGYDNGGTKRMKIEPIHNNQGPRGSSTGADPSKFPSDNERILKLIHDHGNAANGAPACLSKVGPDLVSESNGEKRKREPNHHNLQRTTQIQLPQPTESMQPNHNLLSSQLSTDINRAVYVNTPHAYRGQPPLPVSPPPPLPMEPPRNHFFGPLTSPPVQKPSLFPIDSSASHSTVAENQPSTHVYYANNTSHHASSLSSSEEFYTRQASSDKHVRDVQLFPLHHLSSEKPNIIDASQIFKQPHRASRPDHLVIILRGLPGSGKSYLAKVLRDIEVENGGEAPRIHSMDDYFMTEVEKAEDSELSKSSGSLRGKRQVMKTVMEYCYEPEMEEAYRTSMLKAFKKTLDEGVYSFIIVDDRNLRVADFAQFWATAKRSGYEVYLVEASYTDPAGCAARNVHNFSVEDIQKMSTQWEEAPPLYLKMDVKSLLHGDGFDESGIQEVDMDMEDDDDDGGVDVSHESEIKSPHDNTKDEVDGDFTHHDIGTPDDVKKHHHEVKILSKSKWSNDLDENEVQGKKEKDNALSGLIQSYTSKEAKKSVRWGDQGGDVGFSISATRKATTTSLVIGPGPGYNMKSNPLADDECIKPIEPKTQNVFQERMRAERESFKAVFDKRRQRIGGFNVDED